VPSVAVYRTTVPPTDGYYVVSHKLLIRVLSDKVSDSVILTRYHMRGECRSLWRSFSQRVTGGQRKVDG
jgi:hypothetical protein